MTKLIKMIALIGTLEAIRKNPVEMQQPTIDALIKVYQEWTNEGCKFLD